MPRGASNSYTENRDELIEYNERKYLIQNGSSKDKGNGQYGSGEISYEIDTLNLINIGFNRYYGTQKNKTYSQTIFEDTFNEKKLEYEQNTSGKNTYGSTGINVDYQRSSGKVKDRLFTGSYRLNLSPNEWQSDNVINGILGMGDAWNNQYSDGGTNEHTFQLDYTTPIAKIHTIEAGAKYILRQNKSNSGYREKLTESGDWTERLSFKDEFKHEQNIASGYLGYSLKLKKIGFKAGTRYEYTDVAAKYPLATENNFSSNYSSLVPSATITYQLKPMQNFRLGYNMRIMRPGIWQLNPFANTTDSTNITIGNPKLDAVKSHSFSLNYSYFNPKFNFNANMTYNFSNNSIEQIMTINNGIRTTNFENIGQNKALSLFTYLNWTPTSKIRITSNISGSYTDIKSNNAEGLSNSGFAANGYTNVSYTLPKKCRVNGFGGFGTPYISLQMHGNSYYFYGLSLSKDFLKDKLNVNLSASNFLEGKFKFTRETESPKVYMRTEREFDRSRISLSVSFKFGEMKEQIKKAKRSITNDDSMGGGGSGDGGGGSQGQQGG